VHGAHGYLLDEFLWPATNLRDDQYGGRRPAQRAAFPAEVVAAIRAGVGEDFPVIYRFSQFKNRQYDATVADTPEELAELLTPLVRAGVTAFHASARRFWEPAFPDSNLGLAGWARRLTGLPTIAVGSVGLGEDFLISRDRADSLSALLERYGRGEFDLVAVGRGLLANPDWVSRVRAGVDPVPFAEEHVAVLH
jgi:2,4-dienoyl-CoA reductase-like NADH-dependent reductase (Old Yellow Enzyme family)